MAVIQISKIQVRRGLQENLPQLASGEMGWSVDTQRLFIGNGTLGEGAPEIGNTEIITAGQDILSAIQSYVFVGDESGYDSQTGVNVAGEVRRSLQHKLDEQISARDFGAVGDGVTDDSRALQRAIDQIYPRGTHYNSTKVRRVLHIPAGTYNLGSNALVIPSFATIHGDGPNSTVLKQTLATNVVVRFCDSQGKIGSSLGTSGAVLPYSINLNNLTLQTMTDNNIAVVDSVNDIIFDRVNFVGSLTSPLTIGNDKSAVQFLDTADATSRVTFNQCQFSDTTYGITANGSISGVTINNSLFDTLYQGVYSYEGNAVSPQNIKITNSVFDNIAQEAINSANDSSIISAYNYFKTVGYGNASVINSGTPTSTVLTWESRNNYAFFDSFDRPVVDMTVYPLVTTLGYNGSKFQSAFAVGSSVTFPGDSETLSDNVSVAESTSLVITSVISTVLVEYSVTRDTARRTGVIKASYYQGNVIYDDEYSEIGTTGVTLDFAGNTAGDFASLIYTTTSTGSDATFKYTLRTFN